jgi:hypothetical protein
MKKTNLVFSPLQLGAVAGVIATLAAILAQVPPITVIVRTLLAVLAFCLIGQVLLSVWQTLPSTQLSEDTPEHPLSAETETTEAAITAIQAQTLPLQATQTKAQPLGLPHAASSAPQPVRTQAHQKLAALKT